MCVRMHPSEWYIAFSHCRSCSNTQPPGLVKVHEHPCPHICGMCVCVHVPPPTPAPWKHHEHLQPSEQPCVRQQQGQIIQIKQLVWQRWFINNSNRVCCCNIQCTWEHLICTILHFACEAVGLTCFPQVKCPWKYLKYSKMESTFHACLVLLCVLMISALFRWRTKQNLDYSFLMMYAVSKGVYYVQVCPWKNK